jgi:hypothetical protein
MAISPAPRGISLILPRVKARGRLVGAYAVGNGFKPFPTKYFWGPRKRDFADSTCISQPAEASAQAGPFLSNLGKMTFSAVYRRYLPPLTSMVIPVM